MIKEILFLAGQAVIGLGAAFTQPAVAATVEYHLLPDGPGNFKVTAKVAGDDNGGLSGYGFDLLGEVTTLQHVSPRLAEGQKNGSVGPAGFTLARSADNVPYVAGFQNIVDAGVIPVYNLGTAGSSLAAEGITPLGGCAVTQWEGELVLATGTYSGSFDSLSFWQDGPNAGANVFVDTGGLAVRHPDTLSYFRDRAPQLIDLAPVVEPLPPLPVFPPWMAPTLPPIVEPEPEPEPVDVAAPLVEQPLEPTEPPTEPAVIDNAGEIILWPHSDDLHAQLRDALRLNVGQWLSNRSSQLTTIDVANYGGGGSGVALTTQFSILSALGAMNLVSDFGGANAFDASGIVLRAFTAEQPAAEQGIPEPSSLALTLFCLAAIRTAVRPGGNGIRRGGQFDI